MRKNALNSVFGIPTLLTVLIIISVMSFASLSLMTANAENAAVKRSLRLLESSYETQELALARFSQLKNELENTLKDNPLGTDLSQLIHQFSLAHPELSWDNNTFTLSEISGVTSVTIIAKISLIKTNNDITILSQTLKIENDQDYSLNGDPIWKGPQ